MLEVIGNWQTVYPMAVAIDGAEPDGAASFWDFLSVSQWEQGKPMLSDNFIF